MLKIDFTLQFDFLFVMYLIHASLNELQSRNNLDNLWPLIYDDFTHAGSSPPSGVRNQSGWKLRIPKLKKNKLIQYLNQDIRLRY